MPTSQQTIEQAPIDWKELITEFLNKTINEEIRKETASAPKLTILSIEFPTEMKEEDAIIIRPWFTDNNQARADLNIKIDLKLKIAANMKGLNVKSRVSNLHFSGKFAFGFDPRVLEPSWF